MRQRDENVKIVKSARAIFWNLELNLHPKLTTFFSGVNEKGR